MGRKRKAAEPSSWCYYCERQFEDDKVLVLHQKAKHFKCDSCGKQFGNIGLLVWHAKKAHELEVIKVPNAKPAHDSVAVSVVGMAGIPDEDEDEDVAPQPTGLPSNVPPGLYGPPAYFPAGPPRPSWPGGLPGGYPPPFQPYGAPPLAPPYGMHPHPHHPGFQPYGWAPHAAGMAPGLHPALAPQGWLPPPGTLMPPGMPPPGMLRMPPPQPPPGPPPASALAAPPLAPPAPADDGTAGGGAAETRVVWGDEEHSMEERRARLDQYSGVQAPLPARAQADVDHAIDSRLSAVLGVAQTQVSGNI